MTSRTPFVAFAVSATLLLTGCATAATPDPSPTASVKPNVDAAPAPETTEPDVADAAPDCENIIAPSTIEALDSEGWTYQEREFRLGADLIEGGFECVWGDYSVPSDHVQVFGWAPLDTQAATDAQDALLGEGWLRTDSDGHVYVTEDPANSLAVDEDGFGWSYEFGEGWVTVSDTRQGLQLITLPTG